MMQQLRIRGKGIVREGIRGERGMREEGRNKCTWAKNEGEEGFNVVTFTLSL